MSNGRPTINMMVNSNAADSYALVVRERTPSPVGGVSVELNPRRNNNRWGRSGGRGRGRQGRRAPPQPSMANQSVEYNPHRRNSLSPSPPPPSMPNRNHEYNNVNNALSPLRRRRSRSPLARRSREREQQRSRSPNSLASSQSSSRIRSIHSVGSVHTQSQSPPRSRSLSPEIWIACPATEEDPFDNSFTTFEEWSLPPSTTGQSEHLQHGANAARGGEPERFIPMGRIRDNSLERSPPRPRREDSFGDNNRTKTHSFDSFEKGMSSSLRLNIRDNSLEREAPQPHQQEPSWSDFNAQIRSKTTDLAMLSRHVAGADSRLSPSLQRSNSSRPRSASASRRQMLDRQMEEREQKVLDNRRNNRSSVAVNTAVELALKMIQESQTAGGKKSSLSKVNSTRALNNNSKSSSSMNVTAPGPPPHPPSISKFMPQPTTTTSSSKPMTPPPQSRERGAKSPRNGPAMIVHDNTTDSYSFDDRRQSSSPTTQPGYDNSFNDTRGPVASSSYKNRPFNNDSGPAVLSSVSARSVSNVPASAAGRNRVQVAAYNPPHSRVSPPPPPPQQQQRREQQYPPSASTSPLEDERTNSNGDWRKYQVKGNRRDMSASRGGEELQQQQHHHQQEQQYQQHELQYQQLAPPAASLQHGDSGGGDGDQSWLKFKVGDGNRDKAEQRSASAGRSVSSSKRRGSKMFGREPRNRPGGMNDREKLRSVKQMPFTDHFGDCGMYSGNVNEEGRPDGKGSMKYENGVFYEGTWTDGGQDQKAAANYGRIRGGFTSWSGKGTKATKSGMVLPWNARKNDVHDVGDKTNVRGMEWTDLNGDSGRYTGQVNSDRLPHGEGIMKYSYGLIAEGEWTNGVLKEGPQDRMISAAASMGAGMSVGPSGMSVGPSGMSIGPGTMGAGMSVGPMSVGPMSMGGTMQQPMHHQGHGFPMAHMAMAPMPMMQAPPPMQFGGMNPMMAAPNNAAQHAMISQQNAMMRNMYGGGGSVYGGPPTMGVPPMQMQMPMQMQPRPQMPQNPEKHPISEIKIGN